MNPRQLAVGLSMNPGKHPRIPKHNPDNQGGKGRLLSNGTFPELLNKLQGSANLPGPARYPKKVNSDLF